jgi:two-component system sensor histidine kinase RegB
MPSTAADTLLLRDSASGWVRPRTLILLRWIAAGTQVTIIAIAHFGFGLQLPLGACAFAVMLLILGNLAWMARRSENRQLSEREAVVTLLADLMQLALMLALTGGLNNPFSMLIVGPVTIAATALGRNSTAVLGATTVLLTGVIGVVHLPLRTADGSIFEVPPLYELGFAASIILGVVFLSAYALRVATEIRAMARALTATQMALSREQKLTDLSGIVAAAAHELGTPLATIKLVSAELGAMVKDRPDLAELHDDVRLIAQQADRCRDILRSMGRSGKDDLQMRHVPLAELLREAAEPHAARGRKLVFEVGPDAEGGPRQPMVDRRPEIIHGLRNLIQNAVDFADSTVWIRGRWSAREVEVEIRDDGAGFPPAVLARIGEPFLRGRSGLADDAPGGDARGGMGLGLFIAKTLLERSGAELSLANADPVAEARRAGAGPAKAGAQVKVVWPIMAISTQPTQGLGPNKAITQ